MVHVALAISLLLKDPVVGVGFATYVGKHPWKMRGASLGTKCPDSTVLQPRGLVQSWGIRPYDRHQPNSKQQANCTTRTGGDPTTEQNSPLYEGHTHTQTQRLAAEAGAAYSF